MQATYWSRLISIGLLCLSSAVSAQDGRPITMEGGLVSRDKDTSNVARPGNTRKEGGLLDRYDPLHGSYLSVGVLSMPIRETLPCPDVVCNPGEQLRFSNRSTSADLIGVTYGYRFSRFLAAEVSWFTVETTIDNDASTPHEINLSLTGMTDINVGLRADLPLSISGLSLFGVAGLGWWKTTYVDQTFFDTVNFGHPQRRFLSLKAGVDYFPWNSHIGFELFFIPHRSIAANQTEFSGYGLSLTLR